MSESIKELLQGIAVLEPSAAHGLQVFGLRREPNPAPLEYLTLDEALEMKLAEVTEVSEGGSVPVTAQMCQLLGIDSVLTGFGLPDDNLHAPNEKLHLPTFYRGIEALTRFFSIMGEG